MGRPWHDHPSWDVVQDASDVAGRDIESLLLDAGTEELAETRNAQLATFVMGLVVLDAVERLGIEPTACAGHSLGEYTALVAAGAIGFEDAVRLVAERGEAMQEAADENPGIMLALSGHRRRAGPHRLPAGRRRRVAGQLQRSRRMRHRRPAGRGLPGRRCRQESSAPAHVTEVAVSGAFHTPLMAPAQPRLRKALRNHDVFPAGRPRRSQRRRSPPHRRG